MQRGQLVRSPIAQRARVSYIREFLDWAYATMRSPEWIEVTFWDFFLVAAPDEMRKAFKRKRGPDRRATAKWNWPAMQGLARAAFECCAKGRDVNALLDLSSVSRVLSEWTGPDGKRYLHYGTPANVALNEEAILCAALDEVLCDLRGLAVEALGKCEQCRRYFVRLRAARRRFCSPRCTWQAFQARQRRLPASFTRRAVRKVKL